MPSPVYDTVRWCVPRPSTVKRVRPLRNVCPGMNVNTARPEESRLANPIVLLPSRRMTVPVGAPAPVKAGLTVTDSTSGWPTGAGLDEAVKLVVVAAWLTFTPGQVIRHGRSRFTVLPRGMHHLTVSYTGDGNFAPSVSAPLDLTVV